MKVLITNIILASRSGTEVVTEQLADGFRRAGHDPVIWTSKIGAQGHAMRTRGHTVVERLAQVPFQPDVIHAHHNTMAMAALTAFPRARAVFVCHDATGPFDAAPLHPRIRQYMAVDELCRARLLADGVSPGFVSMLPNAVDEVLFDQAATPPTTLTRALVLTKNSRHLEAVRAACRIAQIELHELGPGTGRSVDDLQKVLPQFDLVIATARMALEAAFAGCAVIVADERGFAGLLTPAVLERWRAANFGRGVLARPLSTSGLVEAIGNYRPEDAAKVTSTLRSEATLKGQIEHLCQLYAGLGEVPISRASEAKLVASFMEDHFPSLDDSRQWRRLLSYDPEHFSASSGARLAQDIFVRMSELMELRYKVPREDARTIRSEPIPAEHFARHVPRPDAPLVHELHEDGFAFFGPYELRPAGSYQVTWLLDLTDADAGGELTFDVLSQDRLLACVTHSADYILGAGVPTLRFEHGRPDQKLEYRVRASGFKRGSLTLTGALLERRT